MTVRALTFCLTLAAVTFLLSACGGSDAGLAPVTRAPANLGEPVTFVQDEVLVSYRQTRVNEFQSTTLYWNGSVRNLGSTVRNARFEVLTTRGPIQRGELQTKIERTQSWGDLLPGQEQLLHLSFSFPNTHQLAVSARFAHD